MKFKGWVEPREGVLISGWAVREDGEPCTVTARIGEENVSTRSTGSRPDLAARGLSRGAGGFQLNVARLLKPGTNRVELCFEDGSPVPGSPVTRVLPGGPPEPAPPAPAPPPVVVPPAPPPVVAEASPPPAAKVMPLRPNGPGSPSSPMTMAELEELSLSDISAAFESGRIKVDPPEVPPMPESPAIPVPPPAPPARRTGIGGWIAGLFGRRAG